MPRPVVPLLALDNGRVRGKYWPYYTTIATALQAFITFMSAESGSFEFFGVTPTDSATNLACHGQTYVILPRPDRFGELLSTVRALGFGLLFEFFLLESVEEIKSFLLCHDLPNEKCRRVSPAAWLT